ncbi:MAG: peptidyl-tRNA hydrolase [Candidatus Brennerbacteria bacterium]|nr:peptidyl-tRNA hydrolase [Candidatus Brennerbacteria bacterium]
MEINFNPARIKLIVGLGNPGKEYENTYHNVGKLAVQSFKELLDSRFYTLDSEVYMNESGSFVKKMLEKHKAKSDELLVVHDDSDIALEDYKISFGRGAAGHKGVESVIKALKTKNFWRLRVGIRNKESRIRQKAEKLVLKKISGRDKKTLEETFERIIPLLLRNSR